MADSTRKQYRTRDELTVGAVEEGEPRGRFTDIPDALTRVQQMCPNSSSGYLLAPPVQWMPSPTDLTR